MISRDEIASDYAEAIADFPSTLVDGAVTIACSHSPIDQTAQVLPGQTEIRSTHTATLCVRDFPNGYTPPAIGKVIQVDGTDYRVASLENLSAVYVQLNLTEKYQKQ